ncbi:MAG: hypothetical protein RL638_767 [Bacteroidota bacterium]|jgi:hypothetical protein
MKESTEFVGAYNYNGLKWPSLSELYLKIFNKPFNESHNASKDIEASAKCFWWLKDNKILSLDKITKDFEVDFAQNISNIKSDKTTLNSYNMEKKILAIKLKTYCESLKDGDSISTKQIEKLFDMVDKLVEILNTEEEDDDDLPIINTSNSNRSPFPLMIEDGEDLPF